MDVLLSKYAATAGRSSPGEPPRSSTPPLRCWNKIAKVLSVSESAATKVVPRGSGSEAAPPGRAGRPQTAWSGGLCASTDCRARTCGGAGRHGSTRQNPNQRGRAARYRRGRDTLSRSPSGTSPRQGRDADQGEASGAGLGDRSGRIAERAPTRPHVLHRPVGVQRVHPVLGGCQRGGGPPSPATQAAGTRSAMACRAGRAAVRTNGDRRRRCAAGGRYTGEVRRSPTPPLTGAGHRGQRARRCRFGWALGAELPTAQPIDHLLGVSLTSGCLLEPGAHLTRIDLQGNERLRPLRTNRGGAVARNRTRRYLGGGRDLRLLLSCGQTRARAPLPTPTLAGFVLDEARSCSWRCATATGTPKKRQNSKALASDGQSADQLWAG